MAKIMRSEDIRTPEFRLAFPSVFSPEKPLNINDDPKYKITLLFDKKTNIDDLKKVCNNLLIKAFGKEALADENYKKPFRDGNEKSDKLEGYKNTIFFTASTKFQPQVIDQKVKPILDQNQIYPGCYCLALIHFFTFDTGPNRGVSVGFSIVQKTRDGEKLGGAPDPDDYFQALEDDNVDDLG